MSDNFGPFFATTVQNQAEANAILEKLVNTARSEAVYSAPVIQGEYTIITASELFLGMGFGYGSGGGGDDPEEAKAHGKPAGMGYGGGGGGGGAAAARPIATIIIGSDGVRVEPIVDVTKIALAFFTTLGTMFLMLRGMKKK
jgi:uncharacterized spore protein YtfJ